MSARPRYWLALWLALYLVMCVWYPEPDPPGGSEAHLTR